MTFAEWMKQVEERLEKSTPGPWTIRHEKVIKVDIAEDYLIPVYLDDDARLIANAPTDLSIALKVIGKLIEQQGKLIELLGHPITKNILNKELNAIVRGQG